MKKVIKKRNFFVIILCIVSCGIGVYAASTYKASDVIYNSSDGTSMNVNEALNDLYNKIKDNGYYFSYKNGTAIYYNPVSGTKCNASEAVSTTGTKTGCMKWYIFNDSSESSTVNMILDHNTTATIVWNSDNKNVAYIDSDLKPEVDKLVSESKWVDIPRLISAEEIAKITEKNIFDSSNTNSWFYFDSNNQTGTANSRGDSRYSWLYDYTNGCTSYGCNIADSNTDGYWTSTTVGTASSGKYVWYVRMSGVLGYLTPSSTSRGIRPVITISKLKLS